MTRRELRVLLYVADHPGVPICGVAAALGLSADLAGNAASRLRSSGRLVARRDGRYRRLWLARPKPCDCGAFAVTHRCGEQNEPIEGVVR